MIMSVCLSVCEPQFNSYTQTLWCPPEPTGRCPSAAPQTVTTGHVTAHEVHLQLHRLRSVVMNGQWERNQHCLECL